MIYLFYKKKKTLDCGVPTVNDVPPSVDLWVRHTRVSV